MSDIENEYLDSQKTDEAREYKKTTGTAMLKGFAGLNFQKAQPDFPIEIIATSQEVLDLAKQAVALTPDIETADWVVMSQLRKAGVPTPKLNDISRTSIGSVTGGQVPKRKLPEEVQEGLDQMSQAVNRLSPGQPEAQIRTRGTYSGPSNSRGWTDQNQPAGKNPDIPKGPETYSAPIGRTSTPGSGFKPQIGGTNPSFSVGRGDMGETAGREVSYDQRASLPYESISQKPGDARTTYKSFDPRFNKSGVTVTPDSGSMETPATAGIPQTERMLTKSHRIKVGENAFVESKSASESETTYMLKHMIAGQFKEIHPFESMLEEDEALSAEAAMGTQLHSDEERKLDDEDERKFEEAEALADEMEKTARKFELEGNWLRRDQAYGQAKSYRAQAQTYMKRIANRHGNQNIPTGL